MYIAAVIGVAPGEAGMSRASQTQTLLLDRLGSQLGSIRLAVPRLLKAACLGAIAEKPDLLVVAGGPRVARRAGQLAYRHQLPILFLPGLRFPDWARQLWGSLSLEEMVSALAREAVLPKALSAGLAGGRIFFASASCGVLPHLRQLRDDVAEVESFSMATKLLARVAATCGLGFAPKITIGCSDAPRIASAVVVGPEGRADSLPSAAVARAGSFACSAWRLEGPLALARAGVRAVAGRDWRSGQNPERFTCTVLTLQAGPKTWLLLDGEALPFKGAVELRYLPRAIQTFAFAPERSRAITRFRPPTALYRTSYSPRRYGTLSGPPTFVSRA